MHTEIELVDYMDSRSRWRVSWDESGRALTEKSSVSVGNTSGVCHKWEGGGRQLICGYFSTTSRLDIEGVPDYMTSLSLLIDSQMVGDGFAIPKIRFRRGVSNRSLEVSSSDGWHCEVHYRARFLREALRKMVWAQTLEYDPIDFIDQMVDVVRVNRPSWLVP
jgi:hypothetical protein